MYTHGLSEVHTYRGILEKCVCLSVCLSVYAVYVCVHTYTWRCVDGIYVYA
jgi:hypothetical protein